MNDELFTTTWLEMVVLVLANRLLALLEYAVVSDI